MKRLILVPLADNPGLGQRPLQWSLDLWGSSNPWFSADDWREFYARASAADYQRWDLAGVDQEQIYLAISTENATEIAPENATENVVGVIALVDFDDLSDYRHLKPWVAAFVVDPDRRAAGWGSAMLSALEEKAREFGIARLYLWTQDQREFYRRRGYELLEHREYPEISIDIMSKPLTS